MENFDIIKILILSTLSFVVAILLTPALTHFLYKYKLGKSIRNTGNTPVFSKLHSHKAGTPTMGGILIWGTLLILTILFYFIHYFWPNSYIGQFNFLTRSETLLPLGALIATAIVGFFDDLIDVKSKGEGGLRMKHRILIYTAISLIGALWFYFKLNWSVFHVLLIGNFQIGLWYIPVFIITIVATAFSVNETDGLDGLAGGTLLSSYASFAVIALIMGRVNLAVFCAVIIGALLAFLWFNITPARFFMGDTGAMALGITLGIIALLINQALLLIIVGLPFVIESLSVIIQMISKKLRHGKKIFKSSPLHHHLEAIGWSEPKIVMRFWVVSGITSVIGIIIFILDKSI